MTEQTSDAQGSDTLAETQAVFAPLLTKEEADIMLHTSSNVPVGGPYRVQLSRKKGWRMPPNTVIVSRPSKWGNPFPLKHYPAQVCVDRYRVWILGNLWSGPSRHDARKELRGKNLACWCPIGSPCHADVLLEIANSIEPKGAK